MDVVFTAPLPPASALRAAIRDSCRIDEAKAVERIQAAAEMPADARDRIAERPHPRRRGAPRAARQGRDRRVSARIRTVFFNKNGQISPLNPGLRCPRRRQTHAPGRWICEKARKVRTFTPDRNSSGEFGLKFMSPIKLSTYAAIAVACAGSAQADDTVTVQSLLKQGFAIVGAITSPAGPGLFHAYPVDTQPD